VPTQLYLSLSGRVLPSVTQVLRLLARPGLVEWAYQLGLRRIPLHQAVEESSQIGTDVHALIARFFQDGQGNADDPDLRPELLHPLELFLSWYVDYSPAPVYVEAPFIDAELGFGGTVDLVASISGSLELIDFKTSASIHDEHLYQLAAYDHLLAAHGIDVSRARIVQLSRHLDRYREQIVSKSELRLRFQVVAHLLHIHHLLQRFPDELKNQEHLQEQERGELGAGTGQ